MLENIKPFYQPIVCVDDGNTLGSEVLGRKINGDEVESLGSFFFDPNITGQEKIELDRVIRKKALKKLKDSGYKGLLFLNIQPQWLYSFKDPGRILPTIQFLQQLNIPGEQIVIEVTESEFVGDMKDLVNILTIYRKFGCKVAIDDLGSGFSNLDRIIYIQPDYLKIDAGLVQSSSRQEFTASLLESLGVFAQRMGVELIFEGVETRRQLAAGLKAGARYYQGFLFSYPTADIDSSNKSYISMEKDLKQHVADEVIVLQKQISLAETYSKKIKKIFADKELILEEYLECLISNNCVPEWLRAYVCDKSGYQKTPNYTKGPKGNWVLQKEYQGRYWGWRPYFIPSLTKSIKLGGGVVSDPYFDLETKEKVYTFCYPINGDHYLFIDCSL